MPLGLKSIGYMGGVVWVMELQVGDVLGDGFPHNNDPCDFDSKPSHQQMMEHKEKGPSTQNKWFEHRSGSCKSKDQLLHPQNEICNTKSGKIKSKSIYDHLQERGSPYSFYTLQQKKRGDPKEERRNASVDILSLIQTEERIFTETALLLLYDVEQHNFFTLF